MQSLIDFANQLLQQYAHLGMWLAGFSLLTLVASALAMPYFVAKIPDDYFIRDPHFTHLRDYLGVGAIITLVIKNMLGIALILAGIAMLVLPGQGLVTLFTGLVLTQFPGKRRMVRHFVRIPSVLSTLNYFRRKQHRPEFELD
ncbi:MAG: hypothetical protein HKO71_03070 [Pseudomonadales bacterium]|nr:hypothetical protein [Pseudomonadales bacterium]